MQNISRLVIDLDFKYIDKLSERQYDLNVVEKIVDNIFSNLTTIFDIEDRALNQIQYKAKLPKNFRVLSHQVEFYGCCKSCQKEKVWK